MAMLSPAWCRTSNENQASFLKIEWPCSHQPFPHFEREPSKFFKDRMAMLSPACCRTCNENQASFFFIEWPCSHQPVSALRTRTKQVFSRSNGHALTSLFPHFAREPSKFFKDRMAMLSPACSRTSNENQASFFKDRMAMLSPACCRTSNENQASFLKIEWPCSHQPGAAVRTRTKKVF